MGRKVRQVFEGRLVQGRHELTIPVSDLANGAYTIVLSNGSQQRTMKFIR
jgi:hypothetical protein